METQQKQQQQQQQQQQQDASTRGRDPTAQIRTENTETVWI